MKLALGALCACALVGSIALAESCITLDFDVTVVDVETLNDIDYVDFAAGETVTYGDLIRLKVRSERTGVYHLWSIDPNGLKNTDFPPVHSSGGTIVLPCGPKHDTQTCPGDLPGAPIFVRNTSEGRGPSNVQTEILVVSYTPCSNRGESVAGKPLPSCDALVDPDRDMARAWAHIGRKELLEIYRPDTGGNTKCGYSEDADGNLVIQKHVEIHSKRPTN